MNTPGEDKYNTVIGNPGNERKKTDFTEQLNDASIDQVFAIDTQHQIITWNRTCEQIWDITKQHALYNNIESVLPQFVGNAAIYNAIQAGFNGFKSFVNATNGDYGKGFFEHHFIPLVENDKVSGLLIIIHDVAHRVKAENKLAELNQVLNRKNKELQQINSEILNFSHVMGHDLKEPLRKIYVFSEMILSQERDNLSGKGKSNFKRIQAAVQRIGLLTDDLLSFSQLSNTQETIENIDLNIILQQSIQSFSESISSKNATVTFETLPCIVGYSSMIKELFQQLISNALKFHSKDTAPNLSISSEIIKGENLYHPDAQKNIEYYSINFQDNGIGVEATYKELIFQMFQKLNKDSYAGSGLGLALCKKITGIHFGFIIMDSEPGEGSTFHCYIPVNTQELFAQQQKTYFTEIRIPGI